MQPDQFTGDGSDFRERVIWVIRNFAGVPTRYKTLEDNFGISARKWQNVCNHVQQPSIEMVAELATVYPFFLSWMITGEGRTLMQLDPKDPKWFKKLLNALEDSPQAEKDMLHRYSDTQLKEHGIEVPDAETPADKEEKRMRLETAISLAEKRKLEKKKNGD